MSREPRYKRIIVKLSGEEMDVPSEPIPIIPRAKKKKAAPKA